MNAYIEGEHIMFIDIFCICISLEGVFLIHLIGVLLSSKKRKLFDFDDTKTLVLLFLINLLSVSEMNLTLKAKTSHRVLKIQHLGDGFKSIWIGFETQF